MFVSFPVVSFLSRIAISEHLDTLEHARQFVRVALALALGVNREAIEDEQLGVIAALVFLLYVAEH
jgi:hypothetical protein